MKKEPPATALAPVETIALDDSESLSTSQEIEEEDEEDLEDDDEVSWIQWFCGLRGNEFFCEVDEEFIEDGFNLCGIRNQVTLYDAALAMILDRELPNPNISDDQHEMIEASAEFLYGLIHARFILTHRGTAAMLEKYKNVEFGRCLRVFCQGQPLLPVGLSDIPRCRTVCCFCPRCQDAYTPRSSRSSQLDGAFFGTTFPHLLLLTYPELAQPKPTTLYIPRVYGFKIHKEEGCQYCSVRALAPRPAQQPAVPADLDFRTNLPNALPSAFTSSSASPSPVPVTTSRAAPFASRDIMNTDDQSVSPPPGASQSSSVSTRK